MKIILLGILFSFCFLAIKAQNSRDTLIYWTHEYQLKWNDFQGTPDTISIGLAGTSCGFFYNSFYRNDSLIFNVSCVFFKNGSWVKNKGKDKETLNHEQKHFDIAKIWATKLSGALKNINADDKQIISCASDVYNRINNQYDSVQALYDKQTTYPYIDIDRQIIWDKKIDSWLRASLSID